MIELAIELTIELTIGLTIELTIELTNELTIELTNGWLASKSQPASQRPARGGTHPGPQGPDGGRDGRPGFSHGGDIPRTQLRTHARTQCKRNRN